MVERESVKKGNLDKFIFAIKPSNLSQDEKETWEGTVSTIRKSITNATTEIKRAL